MITLLWPALTWASGHKRALLAGAIVAGAFALGRYSAPTPAPAVTEKVDDHKVVDSKIASDVVDQKGAEKITITDYDEHAGGSLPPLIDRAIAAHMPVEFCRPIVTPGEDRIIRQTVIEREPEKIETHAATEQHVEEDQHLALTLAPSVSLPRVSVWIEPQILPGFSLHAIGADVRVTDNIWLGAWLGPQAPLSAGISIRYSH